MIERIPCTKCGELILPSTADRTGGTCMPCELGTRESINESKRRRSENQTILKALAEDPKLSPWISNKDAVHAGLTRAARTSTLKFVPFVGLLPYRFGDSPQQVESIAQAKPRRDLSWDLASANDHFDNIRIGYTLDLQATDFSVWPGAGLTVTFNGETILKPSERVNPLSAFLDADPNPREHVGFVIFQSLGVAVTGYHDDDPDQQAICFGAKGHWDESFLRGTHIDLS